MSAADKTDAAAVAACVVEKVLDSGEHVPLICAAAGRLRVFTRDRDGG